LRCHTKGKQLDPIPYIDILAYTSFHLAHEHFDSAVDVGLEILQGFHRVCVRDEAPLHAVDFLIAAGEKVEFAVALINVSVYMSDVVIERTCQTAYQSDLRNRELDPGLASAAMRLLDKASSSFTIDLFECCEVGHAPRCTR
jgi:Ser/Thr protein kinase RdoA (MazF antagonist)